MGTCHYSPDGWCDNPACVDGCRRATSKPTTVPMTDKEMEAWEESLFVLANPWLFPMSAEVAQKVRDGAITDDKLTSTNDVVRKERP
jgi:hypothetical protein